MEEENENYDYANGEKEYNEGEQLGKKRKYVLFNKFLVACPTDPFADNCPPQCNLVVDDNECSLCVCGKAISDANGSPSYSKVSVSGTRLIFKKNFF